MTIDELTERRLTEALRAAVAIVPLEPPTSWTEARARRPDPSDEVRPPVRRSRAHRIGLVIAIVGGLAGAGTGIVAAAGAFASSTKTIHYDGIAVTVPSSWKVGKGSKATGLTMWSPKLAAGKLGTDTPLTCTGCGHPSSAGALTIVSLRFPTRFSPPGLTFRVTRVNGLRVLVARASSGSIVWRIPSLGVEVSGGGSQIRGVFQTLRRSRP